MTWRNDLDVVPFGKRVLLALPKGRVAVGVRIETPIYAPGPVWELDCGTTVRPTHWMPLPERPGPAMWFQVQVNKYAHEGSSFMRDFGKPYASRQEAEAEAEACRRDGYRLVSIVEIARS